MLEACLVLIIWFITGILWKYNKKALAVTYIMNCMLMEFYYIELFGGCLRTYHLMAVLILLLEYKTVLQFLKVRIFRLLCYFAGIALATSILSTESFYAVKSLLSLYLNIMVGVALLVILYNKWLDITAVKQVICYGMIAASCLGVLQFSFLVFGKINIGFSVEQRTQIDIGMIPGGSTEANVFGRLMMVIMALLLPELVKKQREIKGIHFMYVITLFCTIINMTRTVVYPAIAVFCLASIYYLIMRHWRIFRIVLGLIVTTTVFCAAILTSVIPTGGYTRYKISALCSSLTINGDIINQNEVANSTAKEYESENSLTNKDIMLAAEQEKVIQSVMNEKPSNSSVNEKETASTIGAELNGTNSATDTVTTDTTPNKTEISKMDEIVGVATAKEDWNKELKQVGYDVSASYRFGTAEAVLRTVFSDYRTMLLGNGWGQTYMYVNGIATQAGAGDFINVLAYSGILGLGMFLVMEGFCVCGILKRMWRNRKNAGILDNEGVLWSCLIVGGAGLLSTNIIFPYFWFLVAFAIYMECKEKLCDTN